MPADFGRGVSGCCWKPRGCTMTRAQGCRLMGHPLKRAMLLDDPTAPCPKVWQSPAGVPVSCGLLNGHEGDCLEPVA